MDLALGFPSKRVPHPRRLPPFGLATSGNHLYWSVNGEAPPHPGNDLYRYQAEGTGSCEEGGGCLTDLTPDAADPNGAEVVGVLGASGDGSHLYFTANADLDGGGEAQAGNCKGAVGNTKGACSLYHWHEGEIGFVARLDATGGGLNSDSRNWAEQVSAANNGSYTERTSFLAGDGETLLFSSQEQLTGYENGGTPEYYLYRAGQPGLLCVTCHPQRRRPGYGPEPLQLPALGDRPRQQRDHLGPHPLGRRQQGLLRDHRSAGRGRRRRPRGLPERRQRRAGTLPHLPRRL